MGEEETEGGKQGGKGMVARKAAAFIAGSRSCKHGVLLLRIPVIGPLICASFSHPCCRWNIIPSRDSR